eukprot:6174395-Pleurochrysis_carterae.AAC.2
MRCDSAMRCSSLSRARCSEAACSSDAFTWSSNASSDSKFGSCGVSGVDLVLLCAGGAAGAGAARCGGGCCWAASNCASMRIISALLPCCCSGGSGGCPPAEFESSTRFIVLPRPPFGAEAGGSG